MRNALIERVTAETEIQLSLNLDGNGIVHVQTGVGFLDHMLTLFAVHSGFDLTVKCKGDTQIDDHHSIEDIGIALGMCFRECLGDKRGICRYGDITLPMDEALILCAVDISGRPMQVIDLPFPTEKIGSFDTQLIQEFLIAFAMNAGITLHIRMLCGLNSHHIAEGAFKALAHALRKAVAVDPDAVGRILSSKGVLA